MPTHPAIAREVERYLRTGQSDIECNAWTGTHLERTHQAQADLRGALVREVGRLAEGRAHCPLPTSDFAGLTRSKVEPMVRGLFPGSEVDAVMALLERSVVFLTRDNIEEVLLSQMWNHSAWNLANLYLGSVGADLLGPDARKILGLSQETTCYVTASYFQETPPFEDFLVHEAAHVFHNCKRGSAGLPETRRKEWLLDIGFRMRETFAYACEAFSWIVAHGVSKRERCELAGKFAVNNTWGDDEVDRGQLSAIIEAAARSRNGWKVILAKCAPPSRPSARTSSANQGHG